MSLRWRIALGFALVALATAAVIALATPPIVSQGFSDYDNDYDVRAPSSAPATPGSTATFRPILTPPPTEDGESEPRATESPGAESDTGAEAEGAEDGAIANASLPPAATPTLAAPADPVSATPSAPAASPTPAGQVAIVAAPSGADEADPRPSAAPTTNRGAEEATILRLIVAALLAAIAASIVGLFAAGRLVAPLTRLEAAAAGLARGDLSRRSGLANRSDEFGQLGRTFDSMAGQLEEAEASRRRFLQDAAHELKTPLAVIEATSSAIIDGVYPAERRHVETIREQSRVLARIVDDLRTISLAEGGHLPLERRRTDVAAILRSVASAFEARAGGSKIELGVSSPTGLEVNADPDRLRQVIGALVDNAIRHVGPGGHIELSAAPASPLRSAQAASPRVRITVEDDGPGFPPEALGRVFERFYQADPSRSRGTGTSGLGLSIVKAISEAHGGSVGAENRPEGGARIWIELPAAGIEGRVREAPPDARQE